MEAPKHACLNCGAILISAYCHDCGQKSDTHRVTLSHLIKHDLVHGVWHFDRGLLYTLRESILRPGYMAMDYIKGKRVKYYNIFYLILIVLGINILTIVYLKAHYNIAADDEPKGLVLNKDTVDVSYYVKHYFKLLLFLVIPFFALNGFIAFRRLRLNFAEHAIIAGNILLNGAIWYFFVIVGMYTSYDFGSTVFNLFVWGFVVVVWVQPAVVYYQAAGKEYTTGGFLWRAALWYACFALQTWLVLWTITKIAGKTRITLG